MRTKTKLWLDDQRPAPEGNWTTAKTVMEAIKVLIDFDVAEVSLDYDVAWDEGGTDANWPEIRTGLGVVKFMLDYDRLPAVVRIHSANREGATAMRSAIEDRGFFVEVA